MNVLIIGGNGFIGSSLTRELVKTENKVIVADKSFDNLSKVNVKQIRVDFFDTKSLNLILDGKDIVYLCVGTTNPIVSWEDPMREINESVSPIINFVEAAVKHNVKKIVFLSSGGAIYGKNDGILTEKDVPLPYTPYAIGKLTVECLLNYFREKYGINNDIYRIANAYGINQNTNSRQGVIPIWINSILNKKRLYVYGENSKRDYVYVEDVAKLITYSLKKTSCSDLFNIGTGRGITTLELLNIFRDIVGFDFEFEVRPRRIFDTPSSVLDSSKIIAYFPEFKFSILEDKIKEMWDKANKK